MLKMVGINAETATRKIELLLSESRQTKKNKMYKLKSKLIVAVMVIMGITAFISCEKENTINSESSTNEVLKDKSINTAEQTAYDFRQDLIKRVPVFKDVWSMKNFSFDESQLPNIVKLSSNINNTLDTATVFATDINNNSYKIVLTTIPNGLKSQMNVEARWPTTNEWTCLALSLSGAIISGGVGTFATIANFVAIAAVEKGISKNAKIQGWYNGKLEFTFIEEVFDDEISTHMNAYFTINEAGKEPIFIAKGLIKGENDNDIAFPVPYSAPQTEWNNIGNPGDLKEIPNHIYQLDELFVKNPYTLHSSRNALLGELIKLVINK